LVIFGYIYRNLVQFSDRAPLMFSSVGKSIREIENYLLKDTIHLSRWARRGLEQEPGWTAPRGLRQRTWTASRAQYPKF
jgi:hypothetical protein